MRIYADTSWWLAYKCRRDTPHANAITLFDREPDAQVLWTPWQRVESSTLSGKPNAAAGSSHGLLAYQMERIYTLADAILFPTLIKR